MALLERGSLLHDAESAMTIAAQLTNVPIRTSEDVVRVRQAVRAQAVEAGFSLVDQTKLVTAASELARNTLDYGGGGDVTLEVAATTAPAGPAADVRGPGPGHRRHPAGAEGRLHDRRRAGARPGRRQAPVERIRHRVACRRGHPRHDRPMAMTTATFPSRDGSQSHLGRRRAGGGARRTRRIHEERRGRVALVVSELATNLVKHARGGEILLHGVTADDAPGWKCSRSTRVPAFRDFGSAGDGHSTAGSLGNGLGAREAAVRSLRLVLAPAGGPRAARLYRRARGPRRPGVLGGGRSQVPKPGEQRCGDDWAADVGPHRAALFVVDGLGTDRTPRRRRPRRSPSSSGRQPARRPALDDVHLALRPTRGGAVGMAVVDLDEERHELRRDRQHRGVGRRRATSGAASSRRTGPPATSRAGSRSSPIRSPGSRRS